MEYYFEPSYRLSKQEMVFILLAKTLNLPLKIDLNSEKKTLVVQLRKVTATSLA